MTTPSAGKPAPLLVLQATGRSGEPMAGLVALLREGYPVRANATVELSAVTAREAKAITPKPSADAELRLDFHRALGDTPVASARGCAAPVDEAELADPARLFP